MTVGSSLVVELLQFCLAHGPIGALDDFTTREARAAIIRITNGNFRLTTRLTARSIAPWKSTNSTPSPAKSSMQPSKDNIASSGS